MNGIVWEKGFELTGKLRGELQKLMTGK
jgi:hypothetical protein